MNKFMLTAARHWKLLALFNVLLLTTTVYIILFAKKTWTAESKLILPKPTTALNADLGTLGNISSGEGAVFSQQLNALKILSSIITSKDALREVWQQDAEQKEFPRLETYQKLFVVTPQNESTVIEVAVEGSSPELAQQRSEALITAFQKRLGSLRSQEAVQRADFLQAELAIAEDNLQAAETALNNYKSSTNLIDNELQAQETLSAIKDLSTQKSQVTAEIKAREAKVQELSTRLGMTPEEGLQSLRLGEKPEYLALKQSLSDVEAKLARARVQFFEDSPQVKNLLEEKERLVAQLATYGGLEPSAVSQIASSENSSELIQQLILADSEAREAEQTVRQLETEIAQLNQELRQLPGKQKRLIELRRRYNTAEGVHNGLVAQIQESRLNGLSSYPNVQILDAPDVDSKPSKPKRSLVVLGYLLAAAFGNSAIVLFFDRSQSLLDTRDIDEIDIPTLATIPDLKDPEQDIRLNEKVVIEFQRLALSVSMMNLANNRLIVTSTTAGEGKSTVILGLAHALADLGFQVLMVDADYRQAGLSRALGFIQEQESPLTTLTPTPVSERIDLLPNASRPRNIAEFVARGGFEEELNLVQEQSDYDYVLVDSAPVSLTSEAAMMARMIGNVLYVVRPGLADSNEFFASLDRIDVDECNIKGLVINGVNTSKTYLSYQKRAYLPQSIEQ